MRALIIGAGISGVLTAYFLREAGCRVVVVDREPGPADSASFGNGGVVGCTQVEPWAQPGLPVKLLRWLGREDAPVLVRLGQLPHVLGWGWRFLARCNERSVHEALTANVRLTLFSLEQFAKLRQDCAMTGAEYDLTTRGAYKLFFDPQSMAHALQKADALNTLGANVEVLDAKTAGAREPALVPIAHRLAGVLAFPDEEVGDCRKFTRWLADRLTADGVDFRFGVEVSGLRREGPRIRAAITSAGEMEADVFLTAQASHTPILARKLGISVPIIPVKGISVTVPAQPWEGALTSAVMDHSRLFGLMRIGERLRISGSAEVAGYDATPSRARCRALIDSVLEIFPGFARCVEAEEPFLWAGLRGNTPDGVPVLGPTPIENLFINAGHGPEGWSTSCGAARLAASAMLSETPEIDMKGLELARFRLRA